MKNLNNFVTNNSTRAKAGDHDRKENLLISNETVELTDKDIAVSFNFSIYSDRFIILL